MTPYLPTLAIIFSVLVAIVTSTIGFRINQKRLKNGHTLQLLMAFTTNPYVSRADFIVHNICVRGAEIKLGNLSDTERESLRQMLVYYELLCGAYLDGTVDRKAIERFRGNSMKELFRLSQFYIHEVREQLRRGSLYSDFEQVVKKLGGTSNL